MHKAVVDASALLAFLKDESVALQDIEFLLPKSLISSVNACEVATVMARLRIPPEIIEGLIDETVGGIIPFDREQALLAARLWKITKPYGLSLGDRACLALAQQMKLPVYTADQAWGNLKIESLEINFIR